jgi:hypothetical protein
MGSIREARLALPGPYLLTVETSAGKSTVRRELRFWIK